MTKINRLNNNTAEKNTVKINIAKHYNFTGIYHLHLRQRLEVQAERAGHPQTGAEDEANVGRAAEPGQIQEQAPGDRRGGARRSAAAEGESQGAGL